MIKVSVKNFILISHLTNACHMPRPSCPPRFHHPNNIWLRIKLWSTSLCNFLRLIWILYFYVSLRHYHTTLILMPIFRSRFPMEVLSEEQCTDGLMISWGQFGKQLLHRSALKTTLRVKQESSWPWWHISIWHGRCSTACRLPSNPHTRYISGRLKLFSTTITVCG